MKNDVELVSAGIIHGYAHIHVCYVMQLFTSLPTCTAHSHTV